MKIAINAWAIPAAVSFQELFASLSAVGFDGVELNLDKEGASAHALTFSTESSQLNEIVSLSRQAGLPICSISTSLYGSAQLGSSDAEERQRGQAVLRKQLDFARALGADTILVVPGGISDCVSRVEAYQLALDTLTDMKPEIEASGIRVGLENVWNSFFLSPVEMRNFIDQLASKAIGAYFDVGNVAIFSYPEHWIEMLGQRIFKIHIKDFKRPSSWFQGHFVNLYEGTIDWQRVMDGLRAVGYDDWLTAELSIMKQNPELLYRTTHEAMRTMVSR
ncbi:MAG: sugar phosphate isomerase/epimerase family protein [Bacillota bacterium]|nr:sugar phosphate isomerase/epimerase family protein [Bacillota bacterium]